MVKLSLSFHIEFELLRQVLFFFSFFVVFDSNPRNQCL